VSARILIGSDLDLQSMKEAGRKLEDELVEHAHQIKDWDAELELENRRANPAAKLALKNYAE
jgi:hypothetical protein